MSKRGTRSPIERAKAVAVTSTRYVRIISWLVRELWSRYRSSIFVVLASGLAGVGAQGITFGFIVMYANEVVSNGMLEAFGYQVSARSPQALTVVAVSSLISLSLSAVLMFLSRQRSLRLGFDFQAHCSATVLASSGRRFSSRERSSKSLPPEAEVLKLASGDVITINRFSRSLVELPVALMTFIAATAVMIYLSVTLTAMLIPLAIVAGIVMYQFNIRAAGAALRFEKMSRESSQVTKKLHRFLSFLPPVASPAQTMIKRVFTVDAPGQRYDALRQQILAPKKSQLCMNLLAAVCIALIVQYFGIRALSGAPTEWGYLAGYLIALRFALISLRTATSRLTRMSRFYIKVRRLYELQTSRPPSDERFREPLVLFDRAREDGSKRTLLKLERGQIAGLDTMVDANRYSIFNILEVVAEHTDTSVHALLNTTQIVRARPPQSVYSGNPELDQSARFRFPPGTTGESLRKQIQDDTLWAWLCNEVAITEATSLTNLDAESLSEPGTFALAVFEALQSPSSIVILDESGLRDTPVSSILNLLADRIVLLSYAQSDARPGDYNECAVVSIDEKRVLSVMTTQDAEQRISERVRDKGASEQMDDLDEDDDE